MSFPHVELGQLLSETKNAREGIETFGMRSLIMLTPSPRQKQRMPARALRLISPLRATDAALASETKNAREGIETAHSRAPAHHRTSVRVRNKECPRGH